MKKITFALSLLFFGIGYAQSVTLIDPAGDGGFETGTTFAANGWTTAQITGNNRKWYVGTGQTGYTGQRCAFIGNNETTVGNNNAARNVHFYRSVTIPSGATNIVLSFSFKQAVSDVIDEDYYDFVQVNTATTTPVNGSQPPGTVHFGPFPDEDIPLFTTQTVNLPDNLAGTTQNLIFSFESDNADPRGFPAFDNISLTYQAPASTADFNKKKLSFYPNPANNILNLKYEAEMTLVEVYNMLGQQVLQRSLNATEAQIDLSGLQAGSYIVRISADVAVQNIKINKK